MNFNDRQLRQPATFVESKGLILVENLQPTTTNRNENNPEITQHNNKDILNDDVKDIKE